MQKNNFVLWFTGLSGAGKTTLANEISKKLEKRGLKIYRLDGDNIRSVYTKKLGFTKKDRDTNIKIAIRLAKKYQKNFIVIASFITPYLYQRKWCRENLKNFIEIFVDAPLELCEKRDVKGLYKKARKGKITYFTGIDDPYEKPNKPNIHLKTGFLSIKENIQKLIEYLKINNLI